MTSIYDGGSGTSGGSIYGRSIPSSSRRGAIPDYGGGGSHNSRWFPDILGDAGGELADFATGIPAGLYNMGRAGVLDIKENPVPAIFGGVAGPVGSAFAAAGSSELHGKKSHLRKDVGEPVVASYAQKYGPIFRHPLTGSSYDVALHDPIGTGLDIASLLAAPFTGGGTAAAKGLAALRIPGAAATLRAGEALKAGRTLSYTDEAGKLHAVEGVGGTVQPLRRAGQKFTDTVSRTLPETIPGTTRGNPLSMEARVNRREVAAERAATRKLEVAAQPYHHSLVGLNEVEMAAVPALAQGFSRPAYLEFLKGNLDEVRRAAAEADPPVQWEPPTATTRLIDILEKHGPAIDEVIANPNPLVLKAVDQGRALGETAQRIYGEADLLDAETAAARIERPARVMAGSRELTREERASDEFKALDEQLQKARTAEADGDIEAAQHEAEVAGQMAEDMGVEIDSKFRLTGWTTHDEQLMAKNAEGVAAGVEPMYLPHTGPKRGRSMHDSMNLLDPQRIPSEMRHSRMLNFQFGNLLWNPDALTGYYLKATHFDHANRVRAWARTKGRPPEMRHDGEPGKRPGWVWMKPSPNAALPRHVAEHQGRHDALDSLEKIDTQAHKERINELVGDMFPATAEGKGIQEMVDAGWVQVPKRVETMVRHELTQSTNALAKTFDKVIDVWRALVLYSRPAWLVNNIFGQHLLYFLHNSGPSGIRSWLRASQAKVVDGKDIYIRGHKLPGGMKALESKYPTVFEELKGAETLRTGGITRNLTRSMGDEPLGGINRFNPVRRFTGLMKWANHRIADDQTRTAALINQIHRDPELKQLYRQAQGWEGTLGFIKGLIHDKTLVPTKVLGEKVPLEDVLRRIPEKKVEQLLRDEVNGPLGDFRQMSAFERRTLYRAVPFWGWYRTIAAISLRLPLEHPLRVDFIDKLEKAAEASGHGEPKFEVPSWLRGAVDLGPGGGGSERVISTTGLNPFETDVQVANAVASLGGPPKFGSQGPLSIFSPAFGWGLQAYGTDPFYGGEYKGPGSGNLFTRGGAAIVTGLPQYRLGEQTGAIPSDYKSTLYKQSTAQYIANYLGVPVKDVIPSEAERRAEEGQ